MPTLGTFDRRRIENDIDQAEELLERMQAQVEQSHGADREELETEIALLEQRLLNLEALLK